MNAYELANKLDDSLAFLDSMNTQYKNGFGKYRLLPKEVATMLRKQADTIESQGRINRELTERIVELEAEIKLIDELVRGKK